MPPKTEDLDETYTKWEKQEKSSARNIIKGIPTNLLLLVVGIMLIGYFSSQQEITNWEMMQFVGVAIAIAVIMGVQKGKGKEISPAQAYAILRQEVWRKMEANEMPRGEIHMGDEYKLVRRSGEEGEGLRPDYYAISFSIVDIEGYDTLYQGNVLAYSGTVSGMWQVPSGFDKEQEKDVLRVIPGEFLDMRRRQGG